jgi:hypothetical protein
VNKSENHEVKYEPNRKTPAKKFGKSNKDWMKLIRDAGFVHSQLIGGSRKVCFKNVDQRANESGCDKRWNFYLCPSYCRLMQGRAKRGIFI